MIETQIPKVTVIVPNFNHAKYLVQRIESILNQTYQDFEIILMDDLSKDDSRDILEKYSTHPKVTQTIYNDHNSGSPFKQWEKGVNSAKGTYIWIAESDDWCEPSLLETLLEGIEKDKDCVISYCQSFCIDNNNRIKFQSSHQMLSEIVDGIEFIQKYISVPVAIFNASMVLWRKDRFTSVSKEFTTFRFCGDWYFWIQLSRLGKVHISGKVLNYFRKHDADVSGKAYKSGINFIEELRIVNMLYNEKLISEQAYCRAYKSKFTEYWAVKNSIDKTNMPMIKDLFNHPLSPKVSMTRLVPRALWKSIKLKLKKNKNDQRD